MRSSQNIINESLRRRIATRVGNTPKLREDREREICLSISFAYTSLVIEYEVIERGERRPTSTERDVLYDGNISLHMSVTALKAPLDALVATCMLDACGGIKLTRSDQRLHHAMSRCAHFRFSK